MKMGKEKRRSGSGGKGQHAEFIDIGMVGEVKEINPGVRPVSRASG